ncbi:MAG: redoxin domain-containing protein [Clostridium sp.]|nr:redoxin domain-containing protein [Clostridium sp.]
MAFSQLAPCFAKKNVQLLGLSIDSNPSHLAWIYNIFTSTGIQITFPVIADRDGKIAKLYGMISPEVSTSETVRTVYIIDDKQVIRAILNYPMTNGRNIPEILRLVEAIQTSDKEKVATPANWCPGQPVVVPSPKTYSELLERVKCPHGLKCIDWYLCYKNKNYL